MGAILFIIISVLIYTVKILHNSRNLTFDKWVEIFISFFVFVNCTGFGLPLFDLGVKHINGAFGFNFRLEVFMLIAPVFFIVLSQRNNWRLLPIPWYVILGIILFCAINILNPNNASVESSIIAILQLLCYITFLYIVCCSTSLETIFKGIYEGFMYTTIVEVFLCICFPILGITQVVDLFRASTSIRAEERPGAPGTFSHPNSMGGYMSYITTFFTTCYLLGYEKKKSLIYTLLAAFALLFTFSRTALVACATAIIVMIVIFKTYNGRIFTIKNIFTIILPLIIATLALIFFTPLKNSFIGSNMDEMMIARLLHFYCGYETIKEFPFFGVGFNAHLEYIRHNISFGETFGDLNRIFWQAEEFMFSHPIHNIPLIFLSELGIVGTLPIIIFIVRRFAKIKSIIRNDNTVYEKIMFLYSICLICCVGIHGMADWAPLSSQLRNVWILVFFVTAIHRLSSSTKKPAY